VKSKRVGVAYLATGQADNDHIALGGLDLSKEVALLFVGNPAGLLAIVGFALIDALLFEGHEQVGCWVWVLTLLLHDAWHVSSFFCLVDGNNQIDTQSWKKNSQGALLLEWREEVDENEIEACGPESERVSHSDWPARRSVVEGDLVGG
jgi:hypothetical protein